MLVLRIGSAWLGLFHLRPLVDRGISKPPLPFFPLLGTMEGKGGGLHAKSNYDRDSRYHQLRQFPSTHADVVAAIQDIIG